MEMIRSTIWVLLAILCSGCLPSTKIYKNPDDHDCGVRYYRPKPYLLVKPMVSDDGTPVNGFVTVEMVMMPDFSEEYSIHVRSGLGTNETEITLADGWRLDTLNVNVDSQFDENLKAIAEVAKAVPSLTSANATDARMNVSATNVPLGFYEAVVSQGRDCKKRLYGFRYIGFMPYSPCPIESCGMEQQGCYDSEVYALLFENNAMVFRPLNDAAKPKVVESGTAADDDAESIQFPVIGDELLAPVADSA